MCCQKRWKEARHVAGGAGDRDAYRTLDRTEAGRPGLPSSDRPDMVLKESRRKASGSRRPGSRPLLGSVDLKVLPLPLEVVSGLDEISSSGKFRWAFLAVGL